MSILRGIFILMVFFIGLYILKDSSAVQGTSAQSGTNPFVQFFNDIKTSTVNLPGILKNNNPTPSVNNSGSSTLSTTSVNSNISNNTVLATHTVPIATQNISQLKNQGKVEVSIVGDTSVELSPDGIVQYTNVERLKGGLKPVVINQKLSISAGNKLQDIFKSQYFEHISPAGVGVSDLSKQAGYEYVVVGENLALGSFGSNKALLEAWMASPGHKANIMDGRYQDIGVAVGRGMFQGSMQWVAVQHFGKPITACVHFDPNLKTTIDTNKAYLVNQEKKIVALKNQIDSSTGAGYREKAEEYNDMVKDYNVRLISLQNDVAKYNTLAGEFNACIGTNTSKT